MRRVGKQRNRMGRAHEDRIERLPEVLRRTGLSRSELYRKMLKGTFPRPVHLGPHSRGWLVSETCTWIRKKQRERDNQA